MDWCENTSSEEDLRQVETSEGDPYVRISERDLRTVMPYAHVKVWHALIMCARAESGEYTKVTHRRLAQLADVQTRAVNTAVMALTKLGLVEGQGRTRGVEIGKALYLVRKVVGAALPKRTERSERVFLIPAKVAHTMAFFSSTVFPYENTQHINALAKAHGADKLLGAIGFKPRKAFVRTSSVCPNFAASGIYSSPMSTCVQVGESQRARVSARLFCDQTPENTVDFVPSAIQKCQTCLYTGTKYRNKKIKSILGSVPEFEKFLPILRFTKQELRNHYGCPMVEFRIPLRGRASPSQGVGSIREGFALPQTQHLTSSGGFAPRPPAGETPAPPTTTGIEIEVHQTVLEASKTILEPSLEVSSPPPPNAVSGATSGVSELAGSKPRATVELGESKPAPRAAPPPPAPANASLPGYESILALGTPVQPRTITDVQASILNGCKATRDPEVPGVEYPSPHVVVPSPRKFVVGDSMELQTLLLARAYEGAVQHVYGKRTWVFKSQKCAPIASRYANLLIKACGALRMIGVSPAAWCIFAINRWKESGLKGADKHPPPIFYALSETMIEKCADWIRGELPTLGGGKHRTPLAQEFFDKQTLYVRLIQCPGSSPRDVVRKVWGTKEARLALLEAARKEVAEFTAVMAEAAQRGDWVWSSPSRWKTKNGTPLWG